MTENKGGDAQQGVPHRLPYRLKRGAAVRRGHPSAGQVFFCFMSTFCLALTLRNADAAVTYMGQGLSLCVRTVIPSLFPFMVLSELLVRSGMGEALGRLFSRPMRHIFGLSGAGSTAVVLGSLCGFPMGAKTAASLLDRNMISREECEHLLTFSNNPGSAFLISAVGVSLYGSKQVGTVLYLAVLGSGLAVGFAARFFLGRGRVESRHPHFPSGLHPGGAAMFTESVSAAAGGMLSVCAYVVFFSTLTGTLRCLSEAVGGLPEGVYACLCGLLELSGGIGEAAALTDRRAGLVLAAVFAGWSGLSVHCQVMSMCAGRGLSFRPYLLAKAAQGVLSGAVMAFLLRLYDLPLPGTAAGDVVTTLLDIGGTLKGGGLSVPAVLSYGGLLFGYVYGQVRDKFGHTPTGTDIHCA